MTKTVRLYVTQYNSLVLVHGTTREWLRDDEKEWRAFHDVRSVEPSPESDEIIAEWHEPTETENGR